MGKKIKITAGVIIALLVIVGLILGGIFLFPFIPNIGIGESEMTIKSIDFVDRISNDQQLQDSHFRILTQIGIGGEEIIGIINKDDLENGKDGDGLPLGWKAEFPLEIRARIDKETAIYSINADNTPSGKLYDIIHFSEPDKLFGSAITCSSSNKKLAGDIILKDINLIPGDRFCLIKRLRGKIGDFESPTVKVDVRFLFKAGSKISREDIISNFGIGSGIREIVDRSGNRIGAVRMTQDSDSVGSNPPNQDNFKAIYLSGTNKWNIHRESSWNEHQQIINDLSLQSSLDNLERTINECQFLALPSKVNGCTINKLDDYTIPSIGSFILLEVFSFGFNEFGLTNVKNRGESGSTVEYIPDQVQLTNVELLFEAEADWIGIRTLVSKPIIEDISCPDFKSGEKGEITVDVFNDGVVTSVFDVDISDSNKFRQTSDVSQQSIKANEIFRFKIPIDGRELTSAEEFVEVKAFSVERPETLFVTKKVFCEMKQPSLCTDGEQITSLGDDDNLCIFACVEGNYKEKPEFCCEDGVNSFIITEGFRNYECKGKVIPPEGECGAWIEIGGQTIIPDLFCLLNNFLRKFILTISIIFGVIGALFAGLISNKLMDKMELSKKWWIILIIALAIGIGIWYLVLIYFWVGVLVLIVFMLIKFIVPGI